MTYLELVNKVLLRLREDEVNTITDPYAKLIGEFVNDAKREVEEAWRWTMLRGSTLVTTSASNFEYALTDLGDRYKILQVLNDTEDTEMQRANSKWMNRQFLLSNAQLGAPNYWDLNGTDVNGDPVINLLPVPDGVYNIVFNTFVPQIDLADETDVLQVPSQPVILGAYMLALSERGEDNGTTFAEALKRYNGSLSDAIAYDASRVPSENIWYPE